MIAIVFGGGTGQTLLKYDFLFNQCIMQDV